MSQSRGVTGFTNLNVTVHALKKRDRHIFPGPRKLWSIYDFVSLIFSRGKNEPVPGRERLRLFRDQFHQD